MSERGVLIGEVARRSGVSARMLRHYDRVGVVSPTGRTSGGYREYREQDVRRLFHVEMLRSLGLSLDEVRRALDEPGFAPRTAVADLIAVTRERITAERELLSRLERVDAAAPEQWGDVLRIVTLLRGLDSPSHGRRQQAVLAQDAPIPADALVAALLDEDDPNVAGALRWSLARHCGTVPHALAAALGSESAEVRARAGAAIAAFPTEEATGLLGALLDDPDPTVRDRTALELGGRGVAAATPALLDLIAAGHRDVEAAEMLGLLADSPTAADGIVAALRTRLDDADPAVRLRITQAFAEIPGSAAESALTALTRDHDHVVAATAAAIVRSR